MSKPLFIKNSGAQTRWISFESPQGLPGRAGMENLGAKGHSSEPFEDGETKTLMDVDGQGVINYIWVTIPDRSPETLRALQLEMYWDGADTPAVSVPMGDFFCHPLGVMTTFENALFSSPEGKSFNCFIDMPFLTHARITLTNNSGKCVQALFYTIQYTLEALDPADTLYFHCVFNRENPTQLCRDYTALNAEGAGVFLGMNVGVNIDPAYGKTWFGEGEVKVYLDGDGQFPTLCGTGTEDYIGTGWGQHRFINRFSGCTVAEERRYGYYRFHINDPVYFHKDITVAIQALGGADKYDLLKAADAGAPYRAVTCGVMGGHTELLMGAPFELTAQSPGGWYNFYRCDDYSSTAYFYLDRAGR